MGNRSPAAGSLNDREGAQMNQEKRTTVFPAEMFIFAAIVFVGMSGCQSYLYKELKRSMAPLLGKSKEELILEDVSNHWDAVEQSVKKLSQSGKLRAPVVNEYLYSEDMIRFRAGLMMLAEMPPKEVASIAEAWLRTPSAENVAKLQELMDILGRQTPAREFIPLFERFLHDPLLSVRSTALHGLVVVGSEEEVLPILEETLLSGKTYLCIPIEGRTPGYEVTLLGGYDQSPARYLVYYGKRTTPILLKALDKVSEPAVVLSVLRSLKAVGDAAALPWCRDNYRTIKDKHVLYWAAMTLLNFGDRTDKKMLLGRFKDHIWIYQSCITREALSLSDWEFMFDICVMAIKDRELMERLDSTLAGQDLFTRMIKERLDFDVDYVYDLRSFKVFWEEYVDLLAPLDPKLGSAKIKTPIEARPTDKKPSNKIIEK